MRDTYAADVYRRILAIRDELERADVPWSEAAEDAAELLSEAARRVCEAAGIEV